MPEEEYEEGKVIGKGSFGSVCIVTRKADRKQYVLKKMPCGSVTPKEQQQYEMEVRLLRQLEHPGIVEYIDSFIDRKKQNWCIVMAFCEGGDVTTYLKKRGGRLMDEDAVMNFFVQMTLALHYIHSQKVLHRDLKTQNIFLQGGTVKMGDFGISKVLSTSRDFASTCIGTPYYMSPELFKNQAYNHKSDVWALGCVLYEMATLKHAFDAQSLNGLAGKIIRGQYPPISPNYSKGLRDLIKDMLATAPAARPNVDQILRKPFMKKRIKDFLTYVLKNRENYRSSDVNNLRRQLNELGYSTMFGEVEGELGVGSATPTPAGPSAVPVAAARLDPNVNPIAAKLRQLEADNQAAIMKTLEEQAKWRAQQAQLRAARQNKMQQELAKKIGEPVETKPKPAPAAVVPVSAARKRTSAAPLLSAPKAKPLVAAPVAKKVEAVKKVEPPKKPTAIGVKTPPLKAEPGDRQRVEDLDHWEAKRVQQQRVANAIGNRLVAAGGLNGNSPSEKALRDYEQEELARKKKADEYQAKLRDQLAKEQAEIMKIKAEREALARRLEEMDAEVRRAPAPSYQPVPRMPQQIARPQEQPRVAPTPSLPTSVSNSNINAIPRSASNASITASASSTNLTARERVLAEKERRQKEADAQRAAELAAASRSYLSERQRAQERQNQLYKPSAPSVSTNVSPSTPPTRSPANARGRDQFFEEPEPQLPLSARSDRGEMAPHPVNASDMKRSASTGALDSPAPEVQQGVSSLEDVDEMEEEEQMAQSRERELEALMMQTKRIEELKQNYLKQYANGFDYGEDDSVAVVPEFSVSDPIKEEDSTFDRNQEAMYGALDGDAYSEFHAYTEPLANRIHNIRSECERALGTLKFEEAYRYVKLNSSNLYGEDGREDESILRNFSAIVGRDKAHYWNVIDQLLFMETNQAEEY